MKNYCIKLFVHDMKKWVTFHYSTEQAMREKSRAMKANGETFTMHQLSSDFTLITY